MKFILYFLLYALLTSCDSEDKILKDLYDSSMEFRIEFLDKLSSADNVYIVEISSIDDIGSDDISTYKELLYKKEQLNMADIQYIIRYVKNYQPKKTLPGLRNIITPRHAIVMVNKNGLTMVHFSRSDLRLTGFDSEVYPEAHTELILFLEMQAKKYGMNTNRNSDYWSQKYSQSVNDDNYHVDQSIFEN